MKDIHPKDNNAWQKIYRLSEHGNFSMNDADQFFIRPAYTMYYHNVSRLHFTTKDFSIDKTILLLLVFEV